MRRENLESRWAKIVNDYTRGSSVLFVEALDVLAAFASQGEDVRARIQDLHAAHPTMALLVKLKHAFREKAPDATQLEAVRKNFLKAQNRAVRVARNLLEKLKPKKILTYSYSGMVLETLRVYRHAHRPVVILSESRPDLEGKVLAEQIVPLGYEIEYTTDMGLFALIQDARIVLVGADAVVPWGVVNKVGTSGVCAVARRMEKPVYALAVSQKFLSITESRDFSLPDDPHPLWENPPSVVHNRVPLFDVTPFDDFSGIIIENGVLSPTEARLQTEDALL